MHLAASTLATSTRRNLTTRFRRVIDSLGQLYEFQPQAVACDAHPDYMSTHYARSLPLPVVPVQHHFAHVLACMVDNGIEGPVLGVSWDGTGYGFDGTVWGSEFLLVPPRPEDRGREPGARFTRFAALRSFPLPGGDRAAREPRRSAVGLLYEILGGGLFETQDLAPLTSFSTGETKLIRSMLRCGVNVPRTGSVGRLFDAVASLTGLRQHSNFEGQAAMELEFLTAAEREDIIPYSLRPRRPASQSGGRITDESLGSAFCCRLGAFGSHSNSKRV